MNKITLISAKGVKNGKVTLEFSQVVETGKTVTSLTSLLNSSDERFNQQKPRYAWMTAQPEDVKKQFNIDVDLAEGEELIIGVSDPRLAANPDTPLNILITETTEGNEYDVANFSTRAKRAGKDGDFIMKDGNYIYVRTSVVNRVVNPADHIILKDTVRQSAGFSSSAIADALGE